MATSWLAAVLLVVCSVVGFMIIARMRTHAKRINDFFLNAVIVWLWLEHVEAKLAALAAAKVAARRQRASMQRCLLLMARDFEGVSGSIPEIAPFVTRLEQLHAEIATKDWTLRDIVEAKQQLASHGPYYLRALERADDKVFNRRFPKLFDAVSLDEVVRAAAKYKGAELAELEAKAAAFELAFNSISAAQSRSDD